MTARVAWAAAASLVAAVLMLGSVLLAGTAGLMVAAVAVSAAVLVAARARLGTDDASPARRPSVAWELKPFAAYRRIGSLLLSSTWSGWHYDRGVRPLLQRLAAAILAERRRVDLYADPPAARALIGDELWPLIDPGRPADPQSDRGAVAHREIARLVDRLEEL